LASKVAKKTKKKKNPKGVSKQCNLKDLGSPDGKPTACKEKKRVVHWRATKSQEEPQGRGIWTRIKGPGFTKRETGAQV